MDMILEAISNYIVVAIIGACFMLGMILKAVTTVVTTSSQERTRREIAAYIAEGSLTPDQGERLLKAQVSSRTITHRQ